MKKKYKIIFSIMFIITMCFSSSVTAFASNSSNDINKNQIDSKIKITQLTTGNPQTFVTKEGDRSINLDLFEQNPKTKAILLVGKMRFGLQWDSITENFEGQWSVALTNGDKIKSVYGMMKVRKDLLGPYNPIIAEMEAYAWYSYGTLYATANGVATGRYNESQGTINYNTSIIYQWRDFFVEGVEKHYYVNNGERQGQINDLSQ